MFKKLGVSLSIIGLISTGLLSAQAHASDLSEALQNTSNQDLSASTTVSIQADNSGQLSDLPFDIDLFSASETIKNNFNISQQSKLNVSLSDFNTASLPAGLSSLSKLWLGVDINATILNAPHSSFFQMTNFKANADSPAMNSILEMTTELMKIFSNKFYKYAPKQIATLLKKNLGTIASSQELENILGLLNSDSIDYKTMVPKIAKIEGRLLDSGLFNVVRTNTITANRRSFSQLKTYTITIADNVDDLQAEEISAAISELFETLLPQFSPYLKSTLEVTNRAENTKMINGILSELAGIDTKLVVLTDDNRITSLEFNANLAALQLPVQISMKSQLSYTSTQQIKAPQTENIIDISKIYKGFITFAGLTSSQLQSEYTPQEESQPMMKKREEKTNSLPDWATTDPGTEAYYELNQGAYQKKLIKNAYDRITSVCDHLRCAEVEVRKFKKKNKDNFRYNTLDEMGKNLLDKLNNHFFYWSGR